MSDLVIRNGRLVLPEGIVRAEMAVSNGKIEKIAITGIPRGDEEIDAREKIVMPGAIDLHVRFHDPSSRRRESFKTGSTAAAAGGVTTVLTMSLHTPVTTPESARRMIEAGRRASLIDFGLVAGNMTEDSVENVKALADMGIRSFKAFTCFPHPLPKKGMEQLMNEIKSVNGTLFVHAEDEATLREAREKVGDRRDPIAHHDARPPEAEERAVREVLKIVKRTDCKTHFTNLTTKKGCELIRDAKGEHLPVTAGVGVHHLVFTRESVGEKGPYLRVNPSLKSEEDQKALWDYLGSQVLDVVTTDHSPKTKREKEVGWRNIWLAGVGAPGVETLLPLLLTYGARRGRLTLERVVTAVSTRPAQITGLYPRKGVIREESDADLVILGLGQKRSLNSKKLHYKVGWSLYEGITLTGYPSVTISRGEIIYKDGKILGKPGRGQYIPL